MRRNICIKCLPYLSKILCKGGNTVANVDTFNLLSIEIAPLAKTSALCDETTKGNSITISIPLLRQMLVLSHLFSTLISPRSQNDDDITHMIKESLYISFIFLI